MILTEKLSSYRILLASKSPRRQQLLEELGLHFEVVTKDVPEIYPPGLKPEEIAVYLSIHKAKAFEEYADDHTIVITADTIVCLENQILGKPLDYEHAVEMLNMLSGKKHKVITGVSLLKGSLINSFAVTTEVVFKILSAEEIAFYVKNYKPFDKAGSYGIQEWIGLVAIEKINGSYFNVMGLPVKELYEELLKIVP